MDVKVDTDRIKQLRQNRGLSQEELATAAGLSLRTVQRIESEGIASLESKKALAGVFGIDSADLDDKREEKARAEKALKQQIGRGMAGVIIGGLLAYAAIIYSLMTGRSTHAEAGVDAAIVAAFCGACGWLVGFIARRRGAHA